MPGRFILKCKVFAVIWYISIYSGGLGLGGDSGSIRTCRFLGNWALAGFSTLVSSWFIIYKFLSYAFAHVAFSLGPSIVGIVGGGVIVSLGLRRVRISSNPGRAYGLIILTL